MLECQYMGTREDTTFVLETVTVLSGSQSSKQFADLLTSQLSKRLRFDVSGLYLYNEAADVLTPVSGVLGDPSQVGYQMSQLPAKGTIKQAAAKTGRTLLCDDLLSSHWTEAHILHSFSPVESILVAPLRVGAEKGENTQHRTIAVLFTTTHARAAFSEQDRLLLERVARHIAPVLDRVLAVEERDALRAISSRMVLGRVTIENVIPTIKDILQQVIPHDMTCLVRFTTDRKAPWFQILHEDGNHVDLEALRQFPVEHMAPVEMQRTGRPVLITGHHQKPFPEMAYFESIGIFSAMLCPLYLGGQLYGFLAVGSRRRNAFSEHHVGLAEQVSHQLSQAISNIKAFEEIRMLKDQLERENIYLREEVSPPLDLKELVGKSSVLQQTLKAVERVAPTDSSVLITGETGTGKELIAQAIHRLSPRRDKPLIKVNCAALTPTLIESELFGHEKGAFTGAVNRKIGRFELADGGTIFLDEVGEIPFDLQAKLLRVLDNQEIERIGRTRSIVLNVRVIAATNQDLEQAVSMGRFRSDLYYRLKVFPIRIPPLRERREDIPSLVRHFAKKYAAQYRKPLATVHADTMVALAGYSWPGNVRELQHVIERAIILSRSSVLMIEELEPQISHPHPGPSTTPIESLAETERAHILDVLNRANWVLAGPHGAAARLGMRRSTLQHRMKKLGIRRPLPTTQ